MDAGGGDGDGCGEDRWSESAFTAISVVPVIRDRRVGRNLSGLSSGFTMVSPHFLHCCPRRLLIWRQSTLQDIVECLQGRLTDLSSENEGPAGGCKVAVCKGDGICMRLAPLWIHINHNTVDRKYLRRGESHLCANALSRHSVAARIRPGTNKKEKTHVRTELRWPFSFELDSVNDLLRV